MPLSFSRPRQAVLLGFLALACSAWAQPQPTLTEAVESAWQLSPQARSLLSRQAELDARARAAGAFLAGPPALSLSHRAGRGQASGARETEAEISAPLWQPRLRTATKSQIDADRQLLATQIDATKLKLAAEARELAAAVALAQVERDAAERKLTEAAALAADVERRVRAGDTARIDLLRAQGAVREAEAMRAVAEGSLSRAQSTWRALTGLSQVAALAEAPVPHATHPLVSAAEAQWNAARARLRLADADRSDPMEVGVGVVRERPGPGAADENAIQVSLRIPLGGDIRNGARIAAARAELDAAGAELDAARRQVEADRQAASAEVAAAQRAHQLALERERLAREAQELVATSHRLGESDLPTRLRADAERFEAELARARAALEARRAITRLNQSNGSVQ
ncbi:TolC family protein [Ramlibacter sp. AN1015]|uniref:TolC family protein n=1 Tax=Ramlibacter sp. AN1015 TaxID=3133428 RepID=UPI0030BF2018